ncbi:LysM peptidoglycan-binding domain-containing protein [Flaviaesturariibacter amylovorans]|uniref:LysM domain-containing protein n=1 Tax=Flaviaesturariibacter amylovorans TaxID=1084520 RepID=A0ABP8GMQ3_9BACT
MKRSIILLAFLCLSYWGFSQDLVVQHGDKGPHLVHTVAAKETFYALGRAYSIAPKEIAAFNGLDMANGLNVGQTVLIPLTAANFSQASGAQGRAVHYVVGEKEGLFRVSSKNGKVLMADLRKWNNLKSDAIVVGQKLVVGYLGGSATGATGAGAAGTTPGATAATPPAGSGTATPPKVDPPVKNDTPVKNDPPAVDPNTPPRKVETVTPPAVAGNPPRTAVSDGRGGFFKTHYEQQLRTQNAGKDQNAIAGIFKTASGWQDMKYYILMDGAEPGTIVKVVNVTNSKTVYAKVLGGMSGIRQNTGFDVRLSNAAASVLETGDAEKFTVRVVY